MRARYFPCWYLISFLWFYWSWIANLVRCPDSWLPELIRGKIGPTTTTSSPLQNTHNVSKEKIHVLLLSYIKSSNWPSLFGSRWLSVTVFFFLLFLFQFLLTSTLSCCIKMHNKKKIKKDLTKCMYIKSSSWPHAWSLT